MLFDSETPIRSFSPAFLPLRCSYVFLYVLYLLCFLNLPQPLYNPHLRAPLGSAGNKGLITPLESALTENSPVSRLESALTKRWGVGVRGYGASRSASWTPVKSHGLPPPEMQLCFL